MYLSSNAEEVLFEVFHTYQKRKRQGMSHIEAKEFQLPLPGDDFINEFESINKQLVDYNAIEINDVSKTYTLTRTGIDYCMRIEYDEYTFEVAKEAAARAAHAQQQAAIAEKDSNFAKVLSVISAVGTFGAFVAAALGLFF